MEFIPFVIGFLILFMCFVSVRQGTIAVVTVFGKYSRIMRPGLNFKLPLIQQIYKRISIQNRSVELEFQATTIDQANVNFKAMLLFAVCNQEEETIKNVAFKFMDEKSFMQALIRTIEGSIRSFVATKKQAEILSLRTEIVKEVKEQLDHTLEGWGFHLLDLQNRFVVQDCCFCCCPIAVACMYFLIDTGEKCNYLFHNNKFKI